MDKHKIIRRSETRVIKIGNLKIGGGNPVLVQSMTQTKTYDVDATVRQIILLEKAGCEIIRVATSDLQSAKAIGEIKKQIHIPIVADVQFQYLSALEAIKQGVDKVRFNPGNIGSKEKVEAIVKACKGKNIPIRIGINMGSLEKDLFAKYGKYGIPRVMLESATRHIKILEDLDFHDIVVSLKGSDVNVTKDVHLLYAMRYNYPLHVGITEAGTVRSGSIKSAVGIGAILSEGIGDTIRVSISGAPQEQVRVGWEILKALKLRQKGVEIISCPTCGRTEIDLIGLANKVEHILKDVNAPIKVAVMGCVVNGPGEASFADIGLCGGKGQAAIMKKGKVIKSVKENEMFALFIDEIKKVLNEKGYKDEIKNIRN
ncbi:4-hydroxy-3-methylbut-2-en-1-yl diphosphate synthase [Candidatus Roizmanbacteria bacterium CG_4_10_14_0_8_um_filter_39_9]|uniref:4-hydroxy-3-methylbut-2-en-1-yl diphosphate synthase (flavodoxin) n=1 Tax=Candidatus Roizmanbacteria bacterium CG_4_10_14_0_8_um_filter_39_9 TaxID=1974829 RepID=A0A2M7QE66_9BACT|nr:MAG: 4-hydroxy-3-methylbut-2-en-1-yl diphosphate synthase [Candidatus Roizmanbacteria bacterium CG_4_10_14_0_8_um_filter_39_9]